MKLIKNIRLLLGIFIALLLLSGITAFPVRTEIKFLIEHINLFPEFIQIWLMKLSTTFSLTPEIILYGTDWLAFAHIIISLFFIPVYINPVKHKANIIIGIISCFAVFPLAFICGPIRGIPFFHQLIDCCFGVGGMLLLFIIYKKINKFQKYEKR